MLFGPYGLFIWKTVTQQGELLGKGEIPAIIETYNNPRWLFTWCSRVTRLVKFPDIAQAGWIYYHVNITRPPEICIWNITAQKYRYVSIDKFSWILGAYSCIMTKFCNVFWRFKLLKPLLCFDTISGSCGNHAANTIQYFIDNWWQFTILNSYTGQ